MINFILAHFVETLKMIDRQIAVCHGMAYRHSATPEPIEPERETMDGLLKYASMIFKRMDLTGALNRLERIDRMWNSTFTYFDLYNELKTLREAIDDDLKFERFYHYSKVDGEIFVRVQADWAKTLASFPSKEMLFEISSGADCYALGHPTAAIFHFMRVAEFGLRALARERRVRLGKGKPIEWGTWQHILDKLELSRKMILTQWKAGERKDAALSFYRGALAGLHSFKDQYRNMVMHVRKPYEMEDAAKVMRQVRDFMNDISKRVGDNTRGGIRKWV